MGELRKHKRFKVRLPAKIEVVSRDPQGETQVVRAESGNIGLGGAFFHTLSPLPEGAPVKVDLALHFRNLVFPLNRWPLLRVQGRVLRSEPTGMAIRFEKRYRIVPHSPF